MSLTFDEGPHIYRFNGAVVPGVTSVLKDLVTYRVDPEALERARQEGVAVHKMVELDCADNLDVDGLPDWLKPRYDAWQKFLRETRFKLVASERRIYHPLYRYAGTLDLEGFVHDDPAIVDIKRSLFMGEVIGLQTSAYAAARDHEKPKAERIKYRAALRLLERGDYKLEPYNDPSHFTVFLACLTRHQFKEKFCD